MPTINQRVIRVTIESVDSETLKDRLESIIEPMEKFEDDPEAAAVFCESYDNDYETIFTCKIEYDVDPNIPISQYPKKID